MIIELTDVNGLPILINTEGLRYARKTLVDDICWTVLVFGEYSINVNETPEEIYAMINPLGQQGKGLSCDRKKR